MIELAHVDRLFDRLAMKLPDGPQKLAATPRNSAVAPVPRRRYLWGVAATALLGIAVVTAALLFRGENQHHAARPSAVGARA